MDARKSGDLQRIGGLVFSLCPLHMQAMLGYLNDLPWRGNQMTPIQCRAGRALVGMTQQALAERSGLTRKSVMLFEGGERSMLPDNVRAVRRELEAAGVELLGGARVGVRLRAGNGA